RLRVTPVRRPTVPAPRSRVNFPPEEQQMPVTVATPLRLGAERRPGTKAIDVVSPIDGRLVGRVALASAAELEEALGRAHRVVPAITPFNFPLNLACHKVAPALACGCPVVLKPSERTPLTGHLLGDVIAQGLEAAGLPADAAHVLPALPADAGPLALDPRVAV